MFDFGQIVAAAHRPVVARRLSWLWPDRFYMQPVLGQTKQLADVPISSRSALTSPSAPPVLLIAFRTISIAVAISGAPSGDEFLVGPIQALKKWDRDTAPKLGEGVVVIEGRLLERGGSRNNPAITHTTDCKIRIKNFPEVAARILVEKDPRAFAILTEEIDPGILNEDELALVDALRALTPERRQAIYNAV